MRKSFFALAIATACSAIAPGFAGAEPQLQTSSNHLSASTKVPASPMSPAPLVAINDAKTGSLLFATDTPGRYVSGPRLATDFRVDINGPTARTTVTQHFANPTDGTVEAVYVFPLPTEAAVDGLRMIIGDRAIVADIKERSKAKRIYDKAKSEGRKATLLVQHRPNIFTQNVANIGPRETIVVQFTYQQRIAMSDAAFRLRLPLVVPPLFNPPPITQTVDFSADGLGQTIGTDPVPDRADITAPVLDPRTTAPTNPVSLKITLNAGFDIGDVKSAHHDITVVTPNDDPARRILTFKDGAVPADRDFELVWTPKAGADPSVGLYRETVDGTDYVLGFVVPPVGAAPAAKPPTPLPREVIFVIDTSGSMGGQSIRQAKAALKLGLDQLTTADTFNIIRFSSTHEVMAWSSLAGSAPNLDRARRFVDALTANGGTRMVPPLAAALHTNAVDVDRVRQVVFLTDGAIGNTAELFAVLSKNRGNSRVFFVGIGSAPNSHLMQRAADLGRGTHTHIGSTGEVGSRMGALLTKLTQPVVTDLSIELIDGRDTLDVTPKVLPDVYANEPVVFAGQTKKLSGRLRMTGRIGRQPWSITVPLAKAATASGISKVWARRKISELETARYLPKQDREALDAALLRVALRHGLVSRLTSLVAVDRKISRPPGAKLTRQMIPLNLPAGWDFDKVFGTSKANDRDASRPSPDQRAEDAISRAPQQSAATGRTHGVQARGQSVAFQRIVQRNGVQPMHNLTAGSGSMMSLNVPQGATDAELKLMFGLALVLLAALLAIGLQRGWFARID